MNDRWNQADIEAAAKWHAVNSTDAQIQSELDLAFRMQCGYMIHILMHAKEMRASYR
jgi:protein-arginine kinase